MELIQFLIWIFIIYLLVGLIFGLWFIFFGVQKLDTNMQSAKWYLRWLFLPGAVGLWPVLLIKLLKRQI